MIRPARPDDVPTMVQFIHDLALHVQKPHLVEVTQEMLEDSLFSDQPVVFAHVAENDDGELVGWALWFFTYSTWLGRHGIFLEDLYVRPESRGAGFGKGLMQELARICINRNYGRLEWMCANSNKSSIDFYTAIGAESLDKSMFRLSDQTLRDFANLSSFEK